MTIKTKFLQKSIDPTKLESDLLVVCADAKDFEIKPNKGGKQKKPVRSAGRPESGSLAAFDAIFSGCVLKRLTKEKFKPKCGSSKLIQIHDSKIASSLLVYGWEEGKHESTPFHQVDRYRQLGATVSAVAHRVGAKRVVVSDVRCDFRTSAYLQAFVEGIELADYKFDRYRAEKDRDGVEGALEEVIILSAKAVSQPTIERGEVVADATKFARDLVNTPAREMRPRDIVAAAKGIAREFNLKCDVLDKRALDRLGAHLLLAVAQGSSEDPYLIKLHYRPKKRAKTTIALIGKGITFDSGGLSIKPAGSMETMKCDMSGAAAVLGAMMAIAQLEPAVEVRAYIPTCENMINGRATRPGDVVRGLSGKTVEILNTDAEGRLILADALTIAVREKSRHYIDLATLTGACVVALGEQIAGLFSNDSKLADRIQKAAEIGGERVWPMPLPNEYEKLIKGNIADIKNTGGRSGGAITAALFLRHFISDESWAHLDIAGPAWSDSAAGHIAKGGTGFGVATLVNFILNL